MNEFKNENVVKLVLLYFVEHVSFQKEWKILIDTQWIALIDNLETFNDCPLGRHVMKDTFWFIKGFGESGIQIPR